MRTETPTPIKLEDYRPAAYLVDRVALDVKLAPLETIVSSRLELRPNPAAQAPGAPLVLDGEQLKLMAVRLDGKPLPAREYQLSDSRLIIPAVPEGPFVLEITTSC